MRRASWHRPCGSSGNCIAYKNEDMARGMFYALIVMLTMSMLLFYLSLLAHRRHSRRRKGSQIDARGLRSHHQPDSPADKLHEGTSRKVSCSPPDRSVPPAPTSSTALSPVAGVTSSEDVQLQRPLQLREPQSKSPSTTTVPDCLNQTPPIKTRTETPAKSPHTGEEPASLREAKRSVPVSGSEVSIPKNEVHRTTAPATKEEDELKKKRDSLCGLLGVYPDFLQKYRTPRVALVVFCLVSFTRTFSMNGVMMVVRPTLERRYQLMSYESGMILSSNDVASCLTMLPVAFLATHRNKPRFIGYGVATLGLGNLIVAAVHFLSPAYELSQAETDLCPMADAVSSCTRSGSIRNFRFMMMFGQLLSGLGATPISAVTIAYIDENVQKRKSSLYIGILNSMAIVGPALGFIVAGYTLSYYVDITTDVSAYVASLIFALRARIRA
ncbi:solute carrier organic anion transporter family member 4A1 [Rhipicephalus sanguineus]|uniref:solute carrier organic anion transporter family member 4A1 n=1 Tax=Rhipicephalus sanguineus TaxID=34632 RepID=UPI0018930EFC|nr:solute carrier organic anion transporter family member 4A1 [Rhipicephalus sanguineus]